MSSLRYQKMCSWGEFNSLHEKIMAEPYISHAYRMDLLRELQQYGRRAVPGVAKKLADATRGKCWLREAAREDQHA